MIPNALGPIIVYTTLMIPMIMLLEAFLSFLGMGVPPPMSSWGVLIKEGAEVMDEFPWLLVFPGFALALALFSFNFFRGWFAGCFGYKGFKGLIGKECKDASNNYVFIGSKKFTSFFPYQERNRSRGEWD